MKLIRATNYAHMSELAADYMIRQVQSAPNTVLGLATGGTPKGVYEKMIEDHHRNGTSYRKVKSVNLDEYVGLSPEDPNSYRTFMEQELFHDIDISPEHTHVPNGVADDLDQECRRYDQLIETLGGIDLQLLGIGQNGHIGFNEPGTSFQKTTHVTKLTEDTRRANARFFEQINQVPTQAITVGIKTILTSRRILLLASGESKAEAIHQLLNQVEQDESFPASALIGYDNMILIADEAALSRYDQMKARERYID
ncbi:glucosamine-6-phosphate deaminase [Tuberibacillus sp. Marseille-P3662]|uniref:glucosamine-6-phosphate deaminase n=1 Tax=Tuberibacillus sp. Marseille-P3662 TaxID=1965358 RepID=UPI000A1CEED1|nr:glucosamine-6-phosphate deaminase [Tuberibacillus sp. Marseille-P3662]